MPGGACLEFPSTTFLDSQGIFLRWHLSKKTEAMAPPEARMGRMSGWGEGYRGVAFSASEKAHGHPSQEPIPLHSLPTPWAQRTPLRCGSSFPR